MTDILIISTFIIVILSLSLLTFLYWYATVKADMNRILRGTSILMSTMLVDSIFLFSMVLNPLLIYDRGFVLIPKFILAVGILNMIRVSFL